MNERATESALGNLHNMLAEEFIQRIRSGKASPSDLNAARQFLKDNNISCDGPQSPRMNSLVDALPDSLEFAQ